MPDIWSLLQDIAGGEFVSAMDLNAGFHHMELTPRASERLSFVTPQGQFRWLTLPMGPSNGPQSFQAAMVRIFDHVSSQRGRVAVFVDDVAVRT